MSDARRIDWKAVALGVAVDIGGSVATGFAFVFVFSFFAFAAGYSLDQVEALFQEDARVVGVSLGIAFAFTALGGFVAGRIAREAEFLHGTLVGLVSLLLYLALPSSEVLWYEVAASLGTIPAAMAGGLLAMRTRNAAPATSPVERSQVQ